MFTLRATKTFWQVRRSYKGAKYIRVIFILEHLNFSEIRPNTDFGRQM